MLLLPLAYDGWIIAEPWDVPKASFLLSHCKVFGFFLMAPVPLAASFLGSNFIHTSFLSKLKVFKPFHSAFLICVLSLWDDTVYIHGGSFPLSQSSPETPSQIYPDMCFTKLLGTCFSIWSSWPSWLTITSCIKAQGKVQIIVQLKGLFLVPSLLLLKVMQKLNTLLHTLEEEIEICVYIQSN
jgi:hypothetical protein